MKLELEKKSPTLEKLDLQTRSVITSELENADLDPVTVTVDVSSRIVDSSVSPQLPKIAKSSSPKIRPNLTPKTSIDLPPSPKSKAAQIKEKSRKPESSLAMNLLRDLETTILKWQREFQEVRQKIQEIYLEGPIIEGWLESYTDSPSKNKRETDKNKTDHPNNGKLALQGKKSGYWLCGRDQNGKIWSKPCPDHEVPEVSIALARYQRLKQLLKQKERIENRLNQMAADLAIIHHNVNSLTNH